MVDGEQQVEEGGGGGGDQDEDDEETRVHARSGDASLTSVSAELCGTRPPVSCEASNLSTSIGDTREFPVASFIFQVLQTWNHEHQNIVCV